MTTAELAAKLRELYVREGTNYVQLAADRLEALEAARPFKDAVIDALIVSCIYNAERHDNDAGAALIDIAEFVHHRATVLEAKALHDRIAELEAANARLRKGLDNYRGQIDRYGWHSAANFLDL